jgi:hypothetical protein
VADFKGWVYLEDEMPRIGSGARLVTAKVGWKWVRAKSVTYPVPQTYTRIHLSKWKNVLRRTEKRGIPWGTTWETVNGK